MTSTYQGEEELLAILDVLALSDDAMFAIDDQHRIVFWNRPIQRLLGFTHDEVAGRSCASVLAGTDAFGNRYCSDACAVKWIVRRGDPVHQFRLGVRAKDGSVIRAEIVVLKFTLRSSHRVLLAHVIHQAEELPAEPADVPRLHRPPAGHADARVRELTVRENEILAMIVAGQNNRIIANRLGISALTARNHVQHIFRKLEVHSRSEAVAFAYRMHIV